MTVSSEVDIANLALDLNNVAPIGSIETPTNPTEELMQRWYDHVRRLALRRHPWNFAGERVILAPDATDPVFGWDKQFTLPADYIRIMHLNESVQTLDTPIPTSLYNVEGGKIQIGSLSTQDTTQLRLVYVSDFTNVPQMDPAFVDYFSTLLAQQTSFKVTQQNSAVERTNALMKEAEDRARSMDGQENPPKRIERSRNRAARRNVSGFRNFDGIIVFD